MPETVLVTNTVSFYSISIDDAERYLFWAVYSPQKIDLALYRPPSMCRDMNFTPPGLLFRIVSRSSLPPTSVKTLSGVGCTLTHSSAAVFASQQLRSAHYLLV